MTFDCHLDNSNQFSTATLSNDLLYLFITPRHGSRRKHSLSIVEVCLLIRCLTMDVLLLRSYSFAGVCLPSRCLAVGLYVTTYICVCMYVYKPYLSQSVKPLSTIVGMQCCGFLCKRDKLLHTDTEWVFRWKIVKREIKLVLSYVILMYIRVYNPAYGFGIEGTDIDYTVLSRSLHIKYKTTTKLVRLKQPVSSFTGEFWRATLPRMRN
jgi:hypothetical protein